MELNELDGAAERKEDDGATGKLRDNWALELPEFDAGAICRPSRTERGNGTLGKVFGDDSNEGLFV